ncbi:hypothetical protein ACIOWI_34690 [Streptomyces sp. NPDC087659]|uniref:hypothetical protein n=1 Tax=unclassified Streptomyces TaxID=2593676 RepID=UPI0036EB0844
MNRLALLGSPPMAIIARRIGVQHRPQVQIHDVAHIDDAEVHDRHHRQVSVHHGLDQAGLHSGGRRSPSARPRDGDRRVHQDMVLHGSPLAVDASQPRVAVPDSTGCTVPWAPEALVGRPYAGRAAARTWKTTN